MKLRPTKCTRCDIEPSVHTTLEPYVDPGETIKKYKHRVKIICDRCKKFSASEDKFNKDKAHLNAIYRWETVDNKTKTSFKDCSSCRVPPVLKLSIREIQHHKDFFELMLTCPRCDKTASCLEIGKDKAVELLVRRWRDK